MGLDESTVCLGDTYRIGDAVFEVSQPRQPCWKLGRRWRLKDLPQKVIANFKSGWYFRVLQEGTIEAGQTVERLTRPHPDWAIVRCSQVWYQPRGNADARKALGQLPVLAAAWRDHLAKG
jgi:MOSC domain-containing protein YiiM